MLEGNMFKFNMFHIRNNVNAFNVKRKPRKKKPNQIAHLNYERFHIKTGFKSAFEYGPKKKVEQLKIERADKKTIDAFKALLNQKVLDTSSWTIEAGLYIHYCFK